MYALYVTHPQVVVDPNKPVPHWGLSEEGRLRAEKFASAGLVRGLKRIISSTETKAMETAEVIASVSGAPVEVLPGFEENDRSSTGYVPYKRFLELRDAFFGRPDLSVEGWETASAAQARIVEAVTRILDRHDAREPLAFVGHGAVGTLLRCALGERPISLAEDQPEGGGCAYMIRLVDRALLSGWMPLESFKGYGDTLSATIPVSPAA